MQSLAMEMLTDLKRQVKLLKIIDAILLIALIISILTRF